MRLLAAAALCLLAGAAAADATGKWMTNPNEEGGFLVVEVAPCGDALCGTIIEARNVSGKVNETYEHLGRQMISGMKPDGANKWDDGEIWAPDEDKTYSANMELKGDVLAVEGCVLVFCRGQDWARFQ